MLVHALRLRFQGVKLTPAELRAQTPLMGHLNFNQSFYQGRDERGLWVCTLMPELGECGWSVELFDARVLRIETRGILVGGVEDTWLRKKRTSYTQVLWAWPVSGEKTRVRPPSATTESMKFIEQLAELV
ncbi:hypothetical protein ACFJIX_18970 [Roseateles sp. UC29_93]|uniref:hypothetical protein n=1 Tax=Roseateles sp. UC29_93 TaxID=3350177 RepID=UPI00366A5E5B